MLVSHADAKILKRRRQAEEDRLAKEDTDAVYATCVEAATRMISDLIGAYQACPSAKCRRRRGCVGELLRCNPIIDADGTYDIGLTVRDMYWDTLDKYADGRPLEDHAEEEFLA
jgi:hypothetical protein